MTRFRSALPRRSAPTVPRRWCSCAVGIAAVVLAGCGSGDDAAVSSSTSANDQSSADTTLDDTTAVECAALDAAAEEGGSVAELVPEWGEGLVVLEEIAVMLDEIGGASFDFDGGTGDAGVDATPSPIAAEFVASFDSRDVESLAELADTVTQKCGEEAGEAVVFSQELLEVAIAPKVDDYCTALAVETADPTALTAAAELAPAEHADRLPLVVERSQALKSSGGDAPAPSDPSEFDAVGATMFGLGLYMEGTCWIPGAAAEMMFASALLAGPA